MRIVVAFTATNKNSPATQCTGYCKSSSRRHEPSELGGKDPAE